MGTALKDIEAKIRSLSPGEKTQLLRSLIAELDGPPEANAKKAWLDVAKRRHEELLAGKVTAVPGEEVFERVRKRLKR